jgi:hypothetical protein
MKHESKLGIFSEVNTPLVHVIGDQIEARVKPSDRKSISDHVWIRFYPGFSFRIMISVNTYSQRNAVADFDPRVSLGVIRGEWDKLPERGISECHRFSYDDLSGISKVDFHPMDRGLIEEAILDRAREAILLEAWGTPYQRELSGIHQIHSCKSSCAVPATQEGRDGALQFYFHEEKRLEMLLFKFCGQ